MKRIIVATAVALAAASGVCAETGGVKLSAAECDSLWMQANPANAAKISESHAQAYISDVKSVNPDGDGTIEKNEFSNACKQGLIKSSASTGASAGAAGKDAPNETSDRTPEAKSGTPLPQKDSVDGETSDRTPKN
jgi:Tfp pilus assembly major pilin PilA